MTRLERDIIKDNIEQIKDILKDFEKYHISQEKAIVGIRVVLRHLDNYMVKVVEE